MVQEHCGSVGSTCGIVTFSTARDWTKTATSTVIALNADPLPCSMPFAGATAWKLIVTSSTDASMRRKTRRIGGNITQTFRDQAS
jgi:hypothetical protein